MYVAVAVALCAKLGAVAMAFRVRLLLTVMALVNGVEELVGTEPSVV